MRVVFVGPSGERIASDNLRPFFALDQFFSVLISESIRD
jgi:hypothetical protein